MIYLNAVLSVVVPLAVLVIPGLVFIRRPHSFSETVPVAARVFLGSVSLLTLGSLLAVWAGWPARAAAAAAAAAALICGLALGRSQKSNVAAFWHTLPAVILFLLLFAAFAAPFLLYHDGLPTGDSQKAIIWAQRIMETNSWPDYGAARELLNRDPVDFYTPGLHAFTALVMSLSPLPLVSVGLMAIALSLAAAVVAAAIAQEILPERTELLYTLLASFLVLTNYRFLRYLKEPGYHWQNVAGELLLFGLFWLVLRLIKRWSAKEAVLGILTAVSLALTHQFSAFIAAFILWPALAVLLVRRKKYRPYFALALMALLVFVTGLGLQDKIPHLFTWQPHLTHLTPGLFDYPRTMGTVWFLAGLAGLTLMGIHLTRRGQQPGLARGQAAGALAAATVILLLLSQGPRWGVDIPPVRALFYSVIPLSVTASYLVLRLVSRFRRSFSPRRARLLVAAVMLTVILSTTSTTARAYRLSHTVRTNSTLTAGQLVLASYLEKQAGGAVLIDDYNRRSASWLVLSGKPMYARLAANVSRQMDEARQSPPRYNLYLNQLDYEKIFALGSQPEAVRLMQKHGIRWVAAVVGHNAAAFSRNPSLREASRADDLVLFEPKADTNYGIFNSRKISFNQWLARASTLVNDIGDREDTFEHLEASLRSTRLSAPFFDGVATYRSTTAPLIPLKFNVGDYVAALWDKEKTGRPDTALELVVVSNLKRPLELITPDGRATTVSLDKSVRIEPERLPFDEKGFITLWLANPQQQAVDIDLIALGMAKVP